MKHLFQSLLIYIIISLFVCSCNGYGKSWDTIYAHQETLFNRHRTTFELSAFALNTSKVYDTSLSINDKYLPLSDSLIKNLKMVGISRIEIHKSSCDTKDIRFIPDSLWYSEEFAILEITYDKCDERSKKGYHWKQKGSEHKHSFGQGGGWFIYSDTDLL